MISQHKLDYYNSCFDASRRPVTHAFPTQAIFCTDVIRNQETIHQQRTARYETHNEAANLTSNTSSSFAREFDARPSFTVYDRTFRPKSAPVRLRGRSKQTQYSSMYQTEYGHHYNSTAPEEPQTFRPPFRRPLVVEPENDPYRNQSKMGQLTGAAMPTTYSVARHRSLGHRTSAIHPPTRLGWKPNYYSQFDRKNSFTMPVSRYDNFLPQQSREFREQAVVE